MKQTKENIERTTQDKPIESVLHSAARDGNPQFVELLIEKGLDLNATNKNGVTPLDIALLCDHIEIARLLLKKGANVKTRDVWGNTPRSF